MDNPIRWFNDRAQPRVARLRTKLEGSERGYALTFDDGPDAHFTPLLLDVLGEIGVPATFFLVGHLAAEQPSIVARMVSEGHSVGSHSYSHLQLRDSRPSHVSSDLVRGHEAVTKASGTTTKLFRPPRGQLTWNVAWTVRRVGLTPWLWTIDTGDWRPNATVESILATTKGISPDDVVLLHDRVSGDDAPAGSEDRSATILSIRGIVDRARELGLAALPLPMP